MNMMRMTILLRKSTLMRIRPFMSMIHLIALFKRFLQTEQKKSLITTQLGTYLEQKTI